MERISFCEIINWTLKQRHQSSKMKAQSIRCES